MSKRKRKLVDVNEVGQWEELLQWRPDPALFEFELDPTLFDFTLPDFDFSLPDFDFSLPDFDLRTS